MTDRAWWHVSDDETTNEWAWNRSDDQEDEARLLDWHCETDIGDLILITICLKCGNALSALPSPGKSKRLSLSFGFRKCEVCE